MPTRPRRFAAPASNATRPSSSRSIRLGWCQRRLQDGRHGAPLARPKARARRESVSGRRRSRPARAGETASLSPALERAPGRETGERQAVRRATHWCGRRAGESVGRERGGSFRLVLLATSAPHDTLAMCGRECGAARGWLHAQAQLISGVSSAAVVASSHSPPDRVPLATPAGARASPSSFLPPPQAKVADAVPSPAPLAAFQAQFACSQAALSLA